MREEREKARVGQELKQAMATSCRRTEGGLQQIQPSAMAKTCRYESYSR